MNHHIICPGLTAENFKIHQNLDQHLYLDGIRYTEKGESLHLQSTCQTVKVYENTVEDSFNVQWVTKICKR